MLLFIAIGCLLAAGASPAAAAKVYVPPFQGHEAVDSHGISYMSGGVSVEERNLMDKMSPDYNLKLVFDIFNGDYLSNIKVKIQNLKGKDIIDTTTKGPFLYTKLPSGTYKVIANFRGDQITRTVKVGGNQSHVVMTWAG